MTVRAPSELIASDRNGSGVQIASTWPFCSADRIAGNGSASSRTEFGSTPPFCSAALIITSPTPLSALTAMVLPARSAGLRIELDPLTRMFCQLFGSLVPSTSLAETSVNGIPCVRAMNIGTKPR